MGPAAPTLQHGPYRPGPQQHGQRLLTSCPTSNNRATNQGQYFWDSEKRHYQSECLKAAATNAVRPEPLEPYAEYGYLTNQPYNGSVKHLGRNLPRPPRPRCNASEGFYRSNPAKGRGQQPRIEIQSRPPGHRIQVSEKVRPPADFTQYHADGTDTLAADIADARHGPTLQDLESDGPDTAAVMDQESEAYSAAPAAVHSLVPATVPDRFFRLTGSSEPRPISVASLQGCYAAAMATKTDSSPPIAFVRTKAYGQDILTNVLIDSGNLCHDLISLEFAAAIRIPITLQHQQIGTAAAGGTVKVIGCAKSFILFLEGIPKPVVLNPKVKQLAHTVNLGQSFLRQNSHHVEFPATRRNIASTGTPSSTAFAAGRHSASQHGR